MPTAININRYTISLSKISTTTVVEAPEPRHVVIALVIRSFSKVCKIAPATVTGVYAPVLNKPPPALIALVPSPKIVLAPASGVIISALIP